MSESTKRIVLTVAALAVVAGAAAAVLGLLGSIPSRQAAGAGGVSRRTETVDQTVSLPLAGIDRIEIEVVSSRVTITEGPDGSATARLRGTVAASGTLQVPELIAETSSGGTASFRVDHKNVGVVLGRLRSDLRLEVSLPKGYRGALAIRSVSADIALSAGRTFTTLEAHSVSGGIDLGAFTADRFTGRSVSGSLRCDAAADSADLSTTSGAIVVGGLTGDCTARSVSGRVALAWTSFSGRIDVVTTSGDVTLAIPAGSGFRLDVRSTSGRIAADHPVTVQGSDAGPGRRSLTGTVGTGQGSVRVRTVSGSITIAP